MGSRRIGLIYAVFASLFVSIASALVKSSSLPVGQTSFFSSLIMFVASFMIAVYRDEYIFPKGRRLRLMTFSLFTGLVVVWDYKAMRLMPLGDEVVASYTSVVFTIILARVFLKEACGRSKMLCTIFIITGVFLIYKSDGSSDLPSYPLYNLGLFLTLCGALFDAATYIFIKDLSELHYSVVLINCGWASMIITGPMRFVEDWSMPSEPITLVLIAVLTLFQELFLYMAVNEGEEASLVSLVQASDIVFSYIWEVAFFYEPHTLFRIFGAGLVTLGVSLAALASELPQSPEKEGYKSLTKNGELPLFVVDSVGKVRKISVQRTKQILNWLQPVKADK